MTETLLCKLQPLNVCMLSRVHRSSFDKWQTALLLVGRPLVMKQWEQNVTKSVHLWYILIDKVSWTFIKQNIFIIYFFLFSVWIHLMQFIQVITILQETSLFRLDVHWTCRNFRSPRILGNGVEKEKAFFPIRRIVLLPRIWRTDIFSVH